MTFKDLGKVISDKSQKLESNDPNHYWKGKKVIPADQWLKITKANTISRKENYNVREGLRYFPHDYIKWIFPLGVPDDLQIEANKWYSEYLELMTHRKNPIFGKEKCFGCLLSTHKEESAIFIGINKLIAKGLEEEEEGGTFPLYPCKIQNRFECPYEKGKKTPNQKFDVDDLFALDEIAFLVELAFGRAENKDSKIQIRTVQDTYHALTDRDTLDKVLQQGLDEENLQYKDQIVKFFMGIKDKVRIEDLFLVVH